MASYPFPKWPLFFYFIGLWRDRGVKALYQFLNRPLARLYSRAIIKKFAPKGTGLEIGVGARTICPVKRTVLSDAYQVHGVDSSIAKVFFPADSIPYKDNFFHFILSEHVLEHLTNPIKALEEWKRVLKEEGILFLFLPHKERTNDHLRSRTTLEHLISDYRADIPPNDCSHFDEWNELVVKKGLMPEHYRHLNKKELLETGSIHHHVWLPHDICQLISFIGLEIVFVDPKVYDRRDSFLVVAKKPKEIVR